MIQHQIEICFKISFINPFKNSRFNKILLELHGRAGLHTIPASQNLRLVFGAHHCFNSAGVDAFGQC